MTNNSSRIKSLCIILINANGLKNHTNELQSVSYNKRIGSVFITETRFVEYLAIHIPGYKLLKCNHPYYISHGGVTILRKSSPIFTNFLTSVKVICNPAR